MKEMLWHAGSTCLVLLKEKTPKHGLFLNIIAYDIIHSEKKPALHGSASN